MVTIEQLEDGTFRVSRVFPCASSMQAGASALERVVPEAFQAGEPACGGQAVDWRGPRLPWKGWFTGTAIGGYIDGGCAGGSVDLDDVTGPTLADSTIELRD